MIKIRTMMEKMERRLSIDLGDLRRFDQNLTARWVPLSPPPPLSFERRPFLLICVCGPSRVARALYAVPAEVARRCVRG
jgi:hypothetical protein